MEGGGGGGGVRRWPATCCSSPPRVGVLLEFARARVSKGLYRERCGDQIGSSVSRV